MHAKPPVSRQIATGAVLLAVVAVIALVGSQATIPNTTGWYAHVEKVPWNPPNWLFGPAWSILYLLIALAGWLIWRAGWRAGKPNAARGALVLFWVQLVLNAVWTPVFFAGYPVLGEAAWWGALAVIVALIATVVALIVSARKWSVAASAMLIPYVLWLLFASTLNAGIIALN